MLVAVVAFWLRRDALARALAIGAVVVAWLSTGATLVAAGSDIGVPGPWAWLSAVPPFDALLVSRFALGAVPLVGLLLALATDRVLAAPAVPGVPVRLLWAGALAAVLLPLVPTPMPTAERPVTPAFFTAGTWQRFVDPGGTLVPVPPADTGNVKPLRWQVGAGLGYAMPGGYFVGTDGSPGRAGRYGAPPRPTAELFSAVRANRPVIVDDRARAQAASDLRYWDADVLVLVPGPRTAALQATVAALLGRLPLPVDGVLLWDARGR